MAILTVLLEILLLLGGIVGFRRTRRGLFALCGVVGGLGVVISAVIYASTKTLIIAAPFDPLLAASVAVVLLAAFRSRDFRESAFDSKLLGALGLGLLRSALVPGPESQDPEVVGHWIARATHDANEALRQLDRLEAPSAEWRRLRDDYIDYATVTIRLISTGVTDDEREWLLSRSDALASQYEMLRRRRFRAP